MTLKCVLVIFDIMSEKDISVNHGVGRSHFDKENDHGSI